jgi:hypothetical protein
MLDRIYSESRSLPESLKAPSRVDSAEFGVWTKYAVFLSWPKAFLQDGSSDTCTNF